MDYQFCLLYSTKKVKQSQLTVSIRVPFVDTPKNKKQERQHVSFVTKKNGLSR